MSVPSQHRPPTIVFMEQFCHVVSPQPSSEVTTTFFNNSILSYNFQGNLIEPNRTQPNRTEQKECKELIDLKKIVWKATSAEGYCWNRSSEVPSWRTKAGMELTAWRTEAWLRLSVKMKWLKLGCGVKAWKWNGKSSLRLKRTDYQLCRIKEIDFNRKKDWSILKKNDWKSAGSQRFNWIHHASQSFNWIKSGRSSILGWTANPV